ncbi:MAG: DNA polymerase III subunit gamma/tau [Nitrospirae bacterium]|nr:DNA polymerase III subunit gamma/tau [Nitrospirota bacterium]
MPYLVLARKWRPQFFEDLVGQDSIIRVIKNALLENRLAHAYLFSGPRGVGKTSTARILAKALNCVNGPTVTPCGTCPSCQSVRVGSFLDVIEIDGASNNSVEDIRELREKVKYAPSGARYKLYIIDEAHMLSTAAFNALLKTLEEPPSHVIFVLATTAPNKIIPTVLSRCQHLPFKRVPSALIKEHLKVIATAEGFNITDEALDLIARAADGGMRDCLTLLDKVASFTTDITATAVRDLLGVADISSISAVANAIINGDRVQILNTVNELYEGGVDLRAFASELIVFFRDALVNSVHNQPRGTSTSTKAPLTTGSLSVPVDIETLTVLLNELIRAHSTIKGFFSPRIALEMTLIKLSLLSSLKGVEGIVSELIQRAARDTESLTTLPSVKSIPQQRVIRQETVRVDATAPPRVDADHKDVLFNLIPTVTGTQKLADAPPTPHIESQEEQSDAQDVTAFTRHNDNVQEGVDTHRLTQDVGFEALWQHVVERVSNVDTPLGAKIQQAIVEFDGDVINVYLAGGSFNLNRSAIEKGKSTIETILEQLSGKKYRMHVKKGSPNETSKSDTSGVKGQDISPVRDLRAEAMADPVIREVLDLFGGHIVKVTPTDR